MTLSRLYMGKSPKESKKTTTRKSRSKLPQTHEKLEDFLEKNKRCETGKRWQKHEMLAFVAKIQNWIIVRGQTVAI